MPFVWQSYGKYLTVSLNATQNDQSFFMWIIVNANFEAISLYSYVVLPQFRPVEENCLKNNLYTIGRGSCFSIQTNFSGSWLESEEICKEKGGELWKPNNKHSWNEVMRSTKNEWYLEKFGAHQPIEYDGTINALPLLKSSSLMYLKFPKYDQDVNRRFFIIPVSFFFT